MSKLAINGGKPLRQSAFPLWPEYDEKELLALEKVLKSGIWGTLGPVAEDISRRFSEYQHCKYGVAVTNGTVSIELLLRSLDIGYGDEVVIPPYTFVATMPSVIMTGATPVFADIDSRTFNIAPESLEKAITPKTKAIIVVHIGGRLCDMDKILEISGRRRIPVIEDAAHAHGSEWRMRRAGSLGIAGSFSFQASKNLCAGEGGMITTNMDEIYKKCWSMHHCGRAESGTVWYEHPFVGTNARMTEWQAAILDVQMDKLDEQIEKRMQNAAYLESLLLCAGFVDVPPVDNRITRNSYHLFVFRYLPERCKGISRDRFCKALAAEGIPCSTGYRCLYKQGSLSSATMKRMTGSSISYGDLSLGNAEHIEREGMWITQNALLGDRKDMEDIAASVKTGFAVSQGP